MSDGWHLTCGACMCVWNQHLTWVHSERQTTRDWITPSHESPRTNQRPDVCSTHAWMGCGSGRGCLNAGRQPPNGISSRLSTCPHPHSFLSVLLNEIICLAHVTKNYPLFFLWQIKFQIWSKSHVNFQLLDSYILPLWSMQDKLRKENDFPTWKISVAFQPRLTFPAVVGNLLRFMQETYSIASHQHRLSIISTQYQRSTHIIILHSSSSSSSIIHHTPTFKACSWTLL